MRETATRDSWENHPIDTQHRIAIDLHFTEKEYTRIQRGLIPPNMEDKWFIFFEDGWLYLHRSWTGMGIYKAQIIKKAEGYAIEEFWVERNPKLYTCEDDIDLEKFSFLIFRGLLGRGVNNLYFSRNVQSEADTITAWSDFGNLLFTNQGLDQTYYIKSGLLGLAVGDALGVPVEFKSRESISKKPITDMIGYGTHNQPPGTFSDDSSLTFCLAEALAQGYDLIQIGKNFVKWLFEGYWTARGEVFDVGNATRESIYKLKEGVNPEAAGAFKASSNGNGSLMRILPLLFYIFDMHPEERFKLVRQVSSLTHRHIRSVIACSYYVEYAKLLLEGIDKFDAIEVLHDNLPDLYTSLEIEQREVEFFNRLLDGYITGLKEEDIQSTGYVLHTLEASIWCILNTDNYKDAVLKAVNLGDDTDTTGAVTGGLAGLLYGWDTIPESWLRQLARRGDIEDLTEQLAENLM